MKTKSARFTAALRGAAIAVFILALGVWVGTGAHTGWTQTTIVEMQHDEITGIDYPVHRSGFIAGIELLALGTGAAAAFAGLSFLPRLRLVPVRARRA